MSVVDASGEGIEFSGSSSPTRKPESSLTPDEIKALRQALVVGLRAAGFTADDVGGLVGASACTVRRWLAHGYPTMEADDQPDRPPSRRRGSDFAGISNRLLTRLKRDYGAGAMTDDNRPIGDIEEVKSWLASLPAKRPP
jgi:hypothetical protein